MVSTQEKIFYMQVLITMTNKTSEIAVYCAENKLRGTFAQCPTAVENTLVRAYCILMYACQLSSKYTQTRAVVPKLGVNYPSGVICDFSGANAKPKPH